MEGRGITDSQDELPFFPETNLNDATCSKFIKLPHFVKQKTLEFSWDTVQHTQFEHQLLSEIEPQIVQKNSRGFIQCTESSQANPAERRRLMVLFLDICFWNWRWHSFPVVCRRSGWRIATYTSMPSLHGDGASFRLIQEWCFTQTGQAWNSQICGWFQNWFCSLSLYFTLFTLLNAKSLQCYQLLGTVACIWLWSWRQK